MSMLSQPQGQTPGRQGAKTLKAHLVLECDEQATWVFRDLPRLLKPAGTQLTVAQAVAAVHDEGWFHADPETFWDTISNRRNQIHRSRERYRADLHQMGYQIAGDYVTDTSDSGTHQILEHLRSTPQDLLVIATRRNGEAETTSGFVGHLATHAPCPVLILKQPLHAAGSLNIMLATDGTEASYTAARRLPEIINMQQAEVTVVTSQFPIYVENPVLAPYINTDAVDEAMTRNGEMILETTRGLLEAEGVRVKAVRQVLGSPSWELLVQASTMHPDLVVVGAHNKPSGTNWLLGSVSSRLVQSASHSVLIVR